ncbi:MULTISPECIES: hypothetical protein [Leptospirillum]|jgi:hypothetical protein|uniref:Uncharacterized protein n=3 Tax=Leptospirillum ferriphilum TaxID=178606 RepID=A0A059XX09_9BACT|nr:MULTISPECIES: hypothetical protein [Leptospirillum]EAY55709.1 MAG: hypothetical protein UBAL2_80270026 [Leptospirillum rubarum]EIJ75444.1 MAG: Hypothetical protein C75L2_00660002 [Leptospirillum sp. Group II 'C75']MCL5259607.1 hypothetical protein [Nitrospirota bacterium]AFS53357.1 hypothetical protein LFML04_1127 [Leptospirillum ferriphilum ML-04]AIA31655.1 hypothetical protein Y981_05190 [Leptospirillum ferriphilum YSK]
MGVGFLSVFLLTSLSCLFFLGVILYLILTPDSLGKNGDGFSSSHPPGESVQGNHTRIRNA